MAKLLYTLNVIDYAMFQKSMTFQAVLLLNCIGMAHINDILKTLTKKFSPTTQENPLRTALLKT